MGWDESEEVVWEQETGLLTVPHAKPDVRRLPQGP